MQEFLDLDLNEDVVTGPKFKRRNVSPRRRNDGYPLTEKRTAKSVVKRLKAELELSQSLEAPLNGRLLREDGPRGVPGQRYHSNLKRNLSPNRKQFQEDHYGSLKVLK